MNASDIMSISVVTVAGTDSVEQAACLMLDNRISGLPVVDAAGKIAGMVTEGDFMRREETGSIKKRLRWLEFCLGPGRLAREYVHTHGRKVDEVMTRHVVSVAEDTPLNEVVSLMERHRVKRVPVLRGGEVVGIVSRANLLRAFMSQIDAGPPVLPTDRTVRDQILAAVAKEAWGPSYGISVVVRNRVVDLWGTIFDERERMALRVLVENVPGVEDIRDHLVWIEPMSGMEFNAPGRLQASQIER
jgi:CBS domain-containing protein